MCSFLTQPRESPRRQATAIGREGELRLRFENHQGKNCLTESYFRTPLQVMRSIPDPAGCLAVYLLTPTGGVVQHDRYEINICLEANTHALITTVAATKVFRMPEGKARQQINIEVGANAILEFVPDSLILFKDADFEQIVTINLQPGAICLFQDSIMGGRVAHQDEFLQFRQLHNHLKIQDSSGLIAYESVRLQPEQEDQSRLGMLDSQTCWGGAYIVGDMGKFNCSTTDFCKLLNDLTVPEYESAISELHRDGLAYRLLANRLEHIDHGFETLRREFRQALNIPFNPIRK